MNDPITAKLLQNGLLSPSSYRNYSLKTHIEGLLLVQLQFFQDHPRLADKLIMAELVLITDRKPAREQCGC